MGCVQNLHMRATLVLKYGGYTGVKQDKETNEVK